mmetsp:Transcript_47804/g.133295  ORF Transcript_47804/g.133295 Transcript_47804/m.133295 type:complete len:235 (-) Transcript_47804:861-1565(-)
MSFSFVPPATCHELSVPVPGWSPSGAAGAISAALRKQPASSSGICSTSSRSCATGAVPTSSHEQHTFSSNAANVSLASHWSNAASTSVVLCLASPWSNAAATPGTLCLASPCSNAAATPMTLCEQPVFFSGASGCSMSRRLGWNSCFCSGRHSRWRYQSPTSSSSARTTSPACGRNGACGSLGACSSGRTAPHVVQKKSLSFKAAPHQHDVFAFACLQSRLWNCQSSFWQLALQ